MKHKLITIWRIIKTGTQNFVRNATLAIAAIAVMIITLTIILFSFIANKALDNTTRQITDLIDISVYLKDDISQERRDQLIQEFKSLENVKSVTYISKDDALNIYKEQNKNDTELLLAISQTDNPLPASLIIKPKNPNNLYSIRDHIETPEIKALQSEETSYSGSRKQSIDNITKAAQFLRQASSVGVVIFAVTSMLIIFNTIRMGIFNHRDELNIMRLLGASTWYIRGPFVVESIIYGVISAIISVSICNLLFVVSSSTFSASSLGILDISFASEYFTSNFPIILISQLAIGIMIGAVSSIIATRRYLKFKTAK